MLYFAPCHQREQNIGRPYETLLGLIPRLNVTSLGGSLDCCGMGGSAGFKKSFYQRSLQLGRPLLKKIREAKQEAVITDCLSCREQITHLLDISVKHPLEILSEAQERARSEEQRPEMSREG